ncbi:hypothetical protein EPN96_03945 [bacterium]|nr:MAG: hypothetical protein EPN96_03945 [bacterium]
MSEEISREELIKKEERLVALLFLALSVMFLLLSFVEGPHGNRYVTILAAFSAGGNLAMALWVWAMRRFFERSAQHTLYLEALGLFLGRPEFPLVKMLMSVVILLGLAVAYLYLH